MKANPIERIRGLALHWAQEPYTPANQAEFLRMLRPHVKALEEEEEKKCIYDIHLQLNAEGIRCSVMLIQAALHSFHGLRKPTAHGQGVYPISNTPCVTVSKVRECLQWFFDRSVQLSPNRARYEGNTDDYGMVYLQQLGRD